MKKIFLLKIFESKPCCVVFVLALAASYFLIPRHVFTYPFYFLAIALMVTSSLTITCFVRTVKERIVNSRKAGASFIGTAAAIVGFSALQVCGIGAPVCGATLGMGFASLIFPGVFFNFLTEYVIAVIIITIAIQIAALYTMKCYKVVN